MHEDQILNPFGFGNPTKVIDENRKPQEWFWDYLEFNEIIVENEFYVLFSDGLLVKKGRSKFKTSQYINGEKFTSFKKVYARV
jgi:hypothetical protein